MANKPGTLELFGIEFAKVFLPLKERIAEGRILTLFAELGVEFPSSLTSNTSFTAAVTTISTETGDLPDLITDVVTAIQNEDWELLIDKGIELAETVAAVVQAIKDLKTALDGISLPSLNATKLANFLADMVRNLLDYLLITYMENYSQTFVAVLQFFGIVEKVQENVGSSDPNFPEYTRKTLHFDKIKDFFKSPPDVLNELYDWGEATFDGVLMLQRLHQILASLGWPVIYDGITPSLEMFIAALQPDLTKSPPGIKLTTSGKVNSANTFTVNGHNYTIEFGVESDLLSGTGITLEPDGNVSLTPPSGTFTGKVSVAFTQSAGGVPFEVFGQPGATRLEMTEIGARAEMTLSGGGGGVSVGQAAVEVEIQNGKFVIKPQNPDGFLAKILPPEGMEIGFDIIAGIDSENGLYFKGGGGLELKLPIHITLGPLELSNILIGITFGGGDGIPIKIGADIQLALGPFVAVVENMGVEATIDFPPAKDGNLGPLDLQLGYKPPTGIGLSLDAKAVKGGGFISFDPDNHRYTGVLELTIKETISVKAIGILLTQLPGGQDGYSLLLLITAEFAPIQLGFGFTLNGVGGLIGVNRTMNLEALRVGVRANTLDNILFPDDPVANAPQIISDLETVFPPMADKYAFGIMGIIGWGTPTLISIEMGIMFEVPNPVRIAILGVVKSILPDEDAALLKLQVNFLGTIDFEQKFLTFDASLFDSRLLNWTLAGDMAIRMKWGDNPAFLLTVGGFHPDFDPPPLALPQLRRLTVNLLGGNNPRLTLKSYFAVTSNTVQFGAGVEFYFKVTKKIRVEGFLRFDALFQFSPFYFKVSFAAGLAVYWKQKTILSISLSVLLEGPTPWHAKGLAEFKVLGIKCKVKFDKTWGQNKNTNLPNIDVLPKLKTAVEDDRNWESIQPDNKARGVTIRKVEATPGQLLVQPDSNISIKQNIVPLGVQISRFGNQKPGDFKKFDLEIFDGSTDITGGEIKEFFAPNDFFNLTQTEKVRRPSFERFRSGKKASIEGGDELVGDLFREKDLVYETAIMDSRQEPPVWTTSSEDPMRYNAWVRNNATARSAKGTKAKGRSATRPQKVLIKEKEYAMASTETLLQHGTEVAKTEMEVRQMIENAIAQDPTLEGKLQVVSTKELL